MKRIDDVNFSSLKLSRIFYIVNRINERILKPKRIGLFVIVASFCISAYLYYRLPDESWPLLLLQAFSQILIFLIWVFAFEFVVGLFKAAFNYSLVTKFMKVNKLIPLGHKVPTGDDYPSNSKLISSILPPSAKAANMFQGVPEYSFTIESSNGQEVTLLQFIYRVPGRIEVDFYFLAAKVVLQRNNMPHIYLDSYKNGRSLMKIAKKESLRLEGDFANYFRMHYAMNDAAPVREVLTPDVMQFLVNAREPYDYEFKGDSLWIIAKGYHMTEYDLKRILYIADKCVDSIS